VRAPRETILVALVIAFIVLMQVLLVLQDREPSPRADHPAPTAPNPPIGEPQRESPRDSEDPASPPPKPKATIRTDVPPPTRATNAVLVRHLEQHLKDPNAVELLRKRMSLDTNPHLRKALASWTLESLRRELGYPESEARLILELRDKLLGG